MHSFLLMMTSIQILKIQNAGMLEHRTIICLFIHIMHRLSDAPSEEHLDTYLALTDSVTEQIMVKGKAADSESAGCCQVLSTCLLAYDCDYFHYLGSRTLGKVDHQG